MTASLVGDLAGWSARGCAQESITALKPASRTACGLMQDAAGGEG